jgi:hypothetical protein
MVVACVTSDGDISARQPFDEVKQNGSRNTVVAARRADSDHHPDRIVALSSPN